MASLARPTSLARLSHSSRSCRSSTSCIQSIPQSRHASSAGAANMRNMPKQQSMASRMKKLRRSEIPTDIGIIPNTFIRPCGQMPSWLTEPRTRMKLEWLYLRQSFLDFAQAIYTHRWNQERDPLTGKRKKIPLGRRERYAVARDLHTKLYTAIATGDRATLSQVACSGLENQQIGRLDRRRMMKEPAESWSVKYNGWILPRRILFTVQSLIPSWFKAIQVVSDREVQLPVGPGIMLRQVVVRVDSRQTRDKKDGSQPVTKKLREYLVLQQTSMEGQDDEWRVWGTTAPTDVPSALEIMNTNKMQGSGGGIVERMRAAMNMM